MHDFKPGWDTYIEGEGYGLEADLAFDQVRAEDYDPFKELTYSRPPC
jgi:protease I